MSETTELVQATIDKVVERVDKLAAKMGIAAAEVWRFTVTAKVIRAGMATFLSTAAAPVVIVDRRYSRYICTRYTQESHSGG